MSILKVVDFPAPFGPNNPNTSPPDTPKLVPFTAFIPFEKVLVI